jgi:hypothetical protein
MRSERYQLCKWTKLLKIRGPGRIVRCIDPNIAPWQEPDQTCKPMQRVCAKLS